MSFEETNTPEHRPRPTMRWWGWLLSLALIVGVVGSLAFPTASTVPQNAVGLQTTTTGTPVWDTSIVEVSVEELQNAYTNSIPKAINMYDAQSLRAVGFLAKVGRDNGLLYADLAPSTVSAVTDRIRFYVADETVFSTLSSVAAGTEVRIVGTCTVSAGEGITFSNCSAVYVTN